MLIVSISSCNECGRSSALPSRFYELELNIQGHKNLTECVTEFLKVTFISCRVVFLSTARNHFGMLLRNIWFTRYDKWILIVVYQSITLSPVRPLVPLKGSFVRLLGGKWEDTWGSCVPYWNSENDQPAYRGHSFQMQRSHSLEHYR